MKTDHFIDVDASAEAAFRVCVEVERWPEIFPPCIDAVVLEETMRSQRVRLTARANDRIFTWESVRSIDRANCRVTFSQVRPAPLVKSMQGVWEFTPKGANGCRITLSHEFELHDDVSGRVEGVATSADAERFMRSTLHANSTRELEAIVTWLRRQAWRHEFSESVVVNASSRAIYDLLRDAENWPSLLPHCLAVDMRYEDPWNQEFTMTVKVDGNVEEIRSIRRLFGDSIEYFQPEPPPALTEHQGHWRLRDTGAGIEVTSSHAVVLNPSFFSAHCATEAKQIVERAINRNSLGTMQAILNKLGAHRE